MWRLIHRLRIVKPCMLFWAILLGGIQPAAARDLPAVRATMDCSALSETGVAPAGEAPARIVTAKLVSQGVVAPYCDVRGYVAPSVRFELHLPTENWRQRLMFSGCGGFCGRVEIRLRAAEGCAATDNGEFAVVTSDLGHDAADGNADTVWAASNRQGKIDYGYRGVHVVTVAAKAIVARFYGQPQTYAYFNGCSDGGREGLMEVQRYPLDFQGVIAGASVIHDTLNNSIFHAWSAQKLRQADGSPMFSTDTLKILHKAALDACDTVGDNVRDGVIGNPAACRFDPAVIRCTSTSNGECLTSQEVEAARALYSGPLDPAGKALYFGRPVGSELGWGGPDVANYARAFISYMSGDEPRAFNLKDVTFDEAAVALFSEMAPIYDATNPDISGFRKSGGKLIMWHGWADPGVPPTSSVDYYERVRAAMGNDVSAFVRLYMLPGVGHCTGGDGPDRINLVHVMMAWVEDGKEPEAIHATRKLFGRIIQTRPVYPYPAVAVYKGGESPLQARSFSPKSR